MNKCKRWVSTVLFTIIFCLLFLSLENYFFKDQTIYTSWYNIQKGKEPIDILFLGSSHIYCNFNTYLINESLGIHSESLAGPGANMLACAENLKVVMKYKTPKVLILDAWPAANDNIDAYRTSSRGNAYTNLDGILSYLDKAQAVINVLGSKDIPESMYQLFRPTNMWSRWKKSPRYYEIDNIFERRDINGYNFRSVSSFATGQINIDQIVANTQKAYETEERDSLSDYNEKGLRDILQIAKANNMEVWLVNSPTTEKLFPKKTLAMLDIAKEYGGFAYFDELNLLMKDYGLEVEDFFDKGHLNRRGAAKLSEHYAELIAERLSINKPDFENVFFIQEEKVETIGSNVFRHTMRNYSPGCQYRFELWINGKLVKKQDFSDQDYFDYDQDIRYLDNNLLYVYMLPKYAPTNNYELRKQTQLKVTFMRPNKSVID